jgi:hypothetical protein
MLPSWVLVAAATAMSPVALEAGAPGPGANEDLITLEICATPKSARPRPTGAALFLNALGDAQRAELARSLEALSRELDKRRNPLFVPLDDADVDAEVDALVKMASPILTAAAALGAGLWQSPEDDIAVRGVRRCARGARCIGVGDREPSGELERRIRFLAWPIGYAIVLGTPSADEAGRVAGMLRAEGTAQSSIALVLAEVDLHSLRRREQLRAVFRHARRIRQSMRDTGSPLDEALANIGRASSAGDEVPWLALPPHTILVVPRLSALATTGLFVEEVRQRLARAGAKAQWLAAPVSHR